MPRRVLIGISGGPGTGKSTFAARTVEELAAKGVTAAVVPMDGFHLPDAELASRGLLASKGAPATFDRAGLEALLERLREAAVPVLAPAYSRESHAVVPDAIEVGPDVRIVLVEGNYLGLWPSTTALLDEIWKLDVPWEVARDRLIARRVSTGRDPREAAEWVDRVDALNFMLVKDSFATRVISDLT
jgi:pantothenate kinase